MDYMFEKLGRPHVEYHSVQASFFIHFIRAPIVQGASLQRFLKLRFQIIIQSEQS